MVGPHYKTQDADRDDRRDHAAVTENSFARKGSEDVANNTEARNYKDVDLGMAEESEQVLVKNWVTAARWVEEAGIKVPVRQEHSNSGR